MATSQNGWPAVEGYGSPLLHQWVIPGADTKLLMRRGSAGFLLAHLATRFDRKVEQLDEPVLDDWAYAYRPVRGYASLSNHASGTAIDLNATDHGLGSEGTFSPAEERTIGKLLNRYDGCIRWGGDYRGRKDEMHFEVDRTLGTCEAVARDLLDTQIGRAVLKANPGQRKVILS